MRKLLALLVLAGATLFTAAPAMASCVYIEMPEWFAEAPVVFTGVVTGTSDDGRVAEVEVLSVYKGQVSVNVTVEGDQIIDPGSGLPLDRSFSEGTTYMFVPSSTASPFRDHPCSPTEPLYPELERRLFEVAGGPGYHPVDFVPPPAVGRNTALWALTLGGAALLIGAVFLRRRRQPHRVEVEGFRLNRGDDQGVGPG